MNNRKILVKPHFLFVLNLLYPYLTLLIIPVIRGFWQYVIGKEGTISQFLLWEFLILIAVIIVAIIKLKMTSIVFDENISIKKGLFCRVEYTIKKDKSMITVIESNPILRLIGVFRLKIYTEAGRRSRPDESILIGVKDAKKLYEINAVNGQSVRSNTYGEVIMSAALSSSATGILLSIPIVKLSFSLLGESLPSLLPKIRSQALKDIQLLKLGQYITVLLVVGYIISFFVLFFRNYGFSSVRSNGKIILQSGKLPRRTVFLSENSINAVKFVTAPLMLLAKKCAVKFSACGYGLGKGEIGLLVPSVKPSIAKGLTKWLLPSYNFINDGLVPPKKAIRRCIKLPLAFILISVVSTIFAYRLYPSTLKPLLPIMSFVILLIVVWSAMRIYGFFKSGLSLTETEIKMKFVKMFHFTEIQSLKRELFCIKISVTPFDRLHGQCSVSVRFQGKNKDTAKVKYIELCKIKEFFGKYL